MFKYLKKLFSKKEETVVSTQVQETETSLYPKEKYTHYWEAIPGWDPELQEHTANVRFYSYTKGFETSSFFHGKSWEEVQKQVNNLIHVEMKNYKR